MPPTPPAYDADRLFAALNHDLRRRIDAVAASDAAAPAVLHPLEVALLGVLGVVAPLLWAWWAL
jgi:hypothetical protein